MGTTKSQIFTEEQKALADMFKVLGQPARIAILDYISKQSGCICNDIVEEIGLAQATISQHLKELKRVQLISGEIEGKKMCYCLNVAQWEKLKKSLDMFFKETQANCC